MQPGAKPANEAVPGQAAPAAGGAVADWTAPAAGGPVRARVRPPGSKSMTNRALVLAALASGPTVITNPLRARDTLLMAAALRSLGTVIDEAGGDGGPGEPGTWQVTPGRPGGGTVIDVGNAGTVLRFVPPVAALGPADVEFRGDERAASRPVGPLLAALRELGAVIDDGGRAAVPFVVRGRGGISGGTVTLDASGSSQLVSGLLLAAPRYDKGAEVRHRGPRVPSAPHIAMTVQMLRDAGAEVETGTDGRGETGPGRSQAGPRRGESAPGRSQAGPGRGESGPGRSQAGPGRGESGPGRSQAGPGRGESGPGRDESGPGRGESGPAWDESGRGRDVPDFWRVQPGELRPSAVTVEPDLSNAAPFLAAALVTGGSVTIAGWPARTVQPAGQILEVLTRMGARCSPGADGMRVTGTGAIRGVTADLADVSEIVPVLTALAALADSPSVFTGIGHMRTHESDRLAALAAEIGGLGGDVTELPDGLQVRPRPLRADGAVFASHDDHRLVMAAAVLGLALPGGLRVGHAATVGKTFPAFTRMWSDMLERSP
jgi:5-enolpyruvylshikimate-3-phosphate synthase